MTVLKVVWRVSKLLMMLIFFLICACSGPLGWMLWIVHVVILIAYYRKNPPKSFDHFLDWF